MCTYDHYPFLIVSRLATESLTAELQHLPHSLREIGGTCFLPKRGKIIILQYLRQLAEDCFRFRRMKTDVYLMFRVLLIPYCFLRQSKEHYIPVNSTNVETLIAMSGHPNIICNYPFAMRCNVSMIHCSQITF